MGEPEQRIGLRERKKIRTREAIRRAAVELVAALGYSKATVERIAEAAEVSHATFFRYFPSKGAALISDEIDRLFIDTLASQPADVPTLEAFRRALEVVKNTTSEDQWAFERTCVALVFSIPELRELQYAEHRRIGGQLAQAECVRLGRDPDDYEVHMFFGALVGAARTALERGRDLPDFLFEALDFIKAGAPLQ